MTAPEKSHILCKIDPEVEAYLRFIIKEITGFNRVLAAFL